jgi:hypothetical protein
MVVNAQATCKLIWRGFFNVIHGQVERIVNQHKVTLALLEPGPFTLVRTAANRCAADLPTSGC